MDLHRIAVYVILSVALLRDTPERPAMYYTDTSHGRSFAKDPDVAWFQGRYLMCLFFQGNRDKGASWYLSMMRVAWDEAGNPCLIRRPDGQTFRLK